MAQNKTFRLFISSPFSDFTKERDVLHKKVFPKIDQYCIDNGFSFQPIDLRWGVSNEAQLDQKTLEVCLEEVRVCKHFPHPNFLIMAGDRYGYVPCPYIIEENEFDLIKKYYEDDKKKITLEYEKDSDEVVSHKAPREVTKQELLEQWYQIDQNQIYVKEDKSESTARILQVRAGDYAIYDNWKVEEDALREILQEAVNQIFEDKSEINKEYQKYFIAATEAEVLEGICDYKYKTEAQKECQDKEDKKYIYAYLREIKEIGDSKNEQKYLDRDKEGKPIVELKKEANKFKSDLNQTLITENILPFESATFSSVDAYEKDDLEAFAEFLIDKLKIAIDEQTNKLDTTTFLEKEKSEQAKFQQDKLEGFLGREKTLKKIKSYIDAPKQQPLVIHGLSGMGKSALIAKAIEQRTSYDKNKQEHQSIDDHRVIYRFVGATERSTTIRNLLTSICDELQDEERIGKVEEYKNDDNEFYEQIKEILSSIAEPTILFIDALDQIQHKEYLQWLPEVLKDNFKIILSVLNDEKYEKDTHYYNLLEKRVDEEHLIDIKEDSLSSSKDSLVKALLEKENRKLDDKQTKKLLDKWKETSYSPLYLKIAIEEVKHWKHGDETQTLASTVEDVILEYMGNLNKIYHHETILIDKVLGYIHTSKDGLSEKELLEILSKDLEDDEIFQKEIINEYHKPIKVANPRRGNKEELVLPMSVWSRLHTQLKPFIIERNIDGQPLMKFFHRQFTTVIDEYIKKEQIQLHTKLADYFLSLQDKTKTWDERYHNLHMLSEYPYQLFHAKKPQELKEILFDLEFAGSVYDHHKQESFRDIMEKASALDGITEDEIYPWESFYRNYQNKILMFNDADWHAHQTLFQLAYEDGMNSPLREKALNLLDTDCVDFYWSKNLEVKPNYERNNLLYIRKLDQNYRDCYLTLDEFININKKGNQNIYESSIVKQYDFQLNEIVVDKNDFIPLSTDKYENIDEIVNSLFSTRKFDLKLDQFDYDKLIEDFNKKYLKHINQQSFAHFDHIDLDFIQEKYEWISCDLQLIWKNSLLIENIDTTSNYLSNKDYTVLIDLNQLYEVLDLEDIEKYVTYYGHPTYYILAYDNRLWVTPMYNIVSFDLYSFNQRTDNLYECMIESDDQDALGKLFHHVDKKIIIMQDGDEEQMAFVSPELELPLIFQCYDMNVQESVQFIDNGIFMVKEKVYGKQSLKGEWSSFIQDYIYNIKGNIVYKSNRPIIDAIAHKEEQLIVLTEDTIEIHYLKVLQKNLSKFSSIDQYDLHNQIQEELNMSWYFVSDINIIQEIMAEALNYPYPLVAEKFKFWGDNMVSRSEKTTTLDPDLMMQNFTSLSCQGGYLDHPSFFMHYDNGTLKLFANKHIIASKNIEKLNFFEKYYFYMHENYILPTTEKSYVIYNMLKKFTDKKTLSRNIQIWDEKHEPIEINIPIEVSQYSDFFTFPLNEETYLLVDHNFNFMKYKIMKGSKQAFSVDYNVNPFDRNSHYYAPPISITSINELLEHIYMSNTDEIFIEDMAMIDEYNLKFSQYKFLEHQYILYCNGTMSKSEFDYMDFCFQGNWINLANQLFYNLTTSDIESILTHYKKEIPLKFLQVCDDILITLSSVLLDTLQQNSIYYDDNKKVYFIKSFLHESLYEFDLLCIDFTWLDILMPDKLSDEIDFEKIKEKCFIKPYSNQLIIDENLIINNQNKILECLKNKENLAKWYNLQQVNLEELEDFIVNFAEEKKYEALEPFKDDEELINYADFIFHDFIDKIYDELQNKFSFVVDGSIGYINKTFRYEESLKDLDYPLDRFE